MTQAQPKFYKRDSMAEYTDAPLILVDLNEWTNVANENVRLYKALEKTVVAIKSAEHYGTMSPDDPGEIIIEMLGILRQALFHFNGGL